MGTVIYNKINKLSKIVELENESEKEIRYERIGALMCFAAVIISVLTLTI